MGNLGFPEMAAIAVLGLLVFGPERLPELARTAARLIHKFRTEATKSINDLKEAADLQDLDKELKSIKDELRGVREDVTSAVKEPAKALKDVGDDLKSISEGGPMAQKQPVTAGPPPMDPEAT